MQPCSKRRLKRLLLTLGILLGGGLGYALLCIMAGGPLLPCLFYEVTGWYCPGCGVSRMCLALLRLDVRAAWQSNPLLLLLLPFGAGAALWAMCAYVREGRVTLSRGQNRMLWAVVLLLVVYGVLRNLPGFEVLRPH